MSAVGADISAHADMPAAVPRQWTARPAAGEASGAILPWHATCLLYDYTDRPDRRTDKTGRKLVPSDTRNRMTDVPTHRSWKLRR